MGGGTKGERRAALGERGAHDHGPLRRRARGAEEPDGPARRTDGTVHGRAEQTGGAAEGIAAPQGRTEGGHEGRRRAARRAASRQDPEFREVQEVRPVRKDPRTPRAVISMGLREKARKSLEGGAEAEDRVTLKVDVAALEAEAKAREDQLRRELVDIRKLSDAKGAQIARQDSKLMQLEARLKELEAAGAAAREASRTLKQAQAELEEARDEVKTLRKSKATVKDAESATEQLRKTRVAVDTKEASLKKREAEVESMVASLNKHDKEIAEREQAISIAQDKLDAEARVVREAGREVQQARAKLDTREAELAERGKAFRDQANQRTTEVKKDLTDHETRVAAFEKKLEAREGEAKTATLAAVEGSAEAEKALKEVRERERTLEKLERKIDGERDKLEEQAKAKQQAHAQEVDELRKLLQIRDREIAKHEKEVESQQIAARSEAEAQERRERGLKAQLTKARRQLQAQIQRIEKRGKKIEVARKEIAKGN